MAQLESLSDMFDVMEKYGAAIITTVWTSDEDPDNDRMVICVQGRPEVEQIREAVEAIEQDWNDANG